MAEIDGALFGGASLKAEDFAGIVLAWSRASRLQIGYIGNNIPMILFKCFIVYGRCWDARTATRCVSFQLFCKLSIVRAFRCEG